MVQMLITNTHILNILSKLFLLYFNWKSFFFFLLFGPWPFFRLDRNSVTKIYSTATDKCNTLSDLLWKRSLSIYRLLEELHLLADSLNNKNVTVVQNMVQHDMVQYLHAIQNVFIKNIILWSFFDSAQKKCKEMWWKCYLVGLLFHLWVLIRI